PATSNLQNPSGILYNSAGTKIVKLFVSTGGCMDSISQPIIINQTPTSSFISTAPQCQGSAVNFTNTGSTGGNWVYNWDFGSGAVPQGSNAENPSGIIYQTSGTKTITLTISDGICSSTKVDTIKIKALPYANAGLDTVICAGTSVQIGSSPIIGYTYSWFPSGSLNNATIADPVASPMAPSTSYIVTVVDSVTGCVNHDVVVITMLAPLIVNAGPDVAICENQTVQIGASLVVGQQYVWSPATGLSNDTIPSPVASPTSTTTYTLSVTGHGCGPVTDEVTVVVYPLPRAYAGPDDTIPEGSSVQLSASGGVQYFWAPPYGLNNVGIFDPVANPATTTTYVVTVVDIFGCLNTDTMTVFVINPNLWLPTAFTPNGDGKNDVLYVRGEGISDFSFGIYNRWGELVFFSRDIKLGWDGKRQLGGEELPEGAYTYFVKGTLSNNTVINSSGMVNLIR
ncbi:MAG TPA: gliding motility-associated C-terminal domain-containing protein, partial [Bacteroidia bacterium]